MKAVFLSAGQGTRMLPLTKNTPKPLLDLGNGQTIIESQLESIKNAGGIDEVFFVIGYRWQQIEAKLSQIDTVPVKFIYNPFYDISNNLLSLWFALPYINEDFVLVNGDNIFEPNVLSNLISEPDDYNITMVIDRKDNYDEDDMKVATTDNRVLRVSKEIPYEETNGESIGMMRFTGNGIQIIKSSVEEMVRDHSNRDVFYLSALQKIMDSGVPVYYSECKESEWSEIDFHPDLEFLRKAIINK